MKFPEKVTTTCILLILCIGVYIYALNTDMYEKVDDYGMLSGFASLVNCLKDDAWVEATAESWETSSSPVLRQMFLYLTDASDEDPSNIIFAHRSMLAFCMVLSVTCWPLCIFATAWRSDGKRLKEFKQNGKRHN